MSDADEIVAAALARPGSSAAETRDALRASGRVSLTTADVRRALGSRPWQIRSTGDDPPRWWPFNGPDDAPSEQFGFTLYHWQVDALAAWRRHGSCGVVEAVTGTGKTMLGIAAAHDELARGGQVCVVVPTRDLADQWDGALRARLGDHVHIGRLGDGRHDHLGRADILVAVVNSARLGDLRPRRPGGLLVADECHRYGSAGNRVVLATAFPRRLGLSATYARADDGHLAWLDPYFGGVIFQMGYSRAIADGVAAHFDARLVGVDFDHVERMHYEDFTATMAGALGELASLGVGLDDGPAGVGFFDLISALARRGGDDRRAMVARRYLRALQDRRHLLAEACGKLDALCDMAERIAASTRTIVFTQSIPATDAAAATLRDAGLSARAIHSKLAMPMRRRLLERFRSGDITVLVAPQILDEGIDVPEADLAIVLAASRSRRQMIQRMGRILRTKPQGQRAEFVIVFVTDTVEDPAHGAHETFLNEITGVSDSVTTERRTSASVPGAPERCHAGGHAREQFEG